MIQTPTPHISAQKGDFAKTVLMPGDPLRAKYIAENYLRDYKCINKIRNMFAYTGKYNNKEVSIMASGMGMASMGIYSHELFNFYDVDNIIRIGSAGSISDQLEIKDIVIGMGACTDSNYVNQYNLSGNFSAIADYELLMKVSTLIPNIKRKVLVGNILSSDLFYVQDESSILKWKNMGILAAEMEAAALYMNAVYANKAALCICTISNKILSNEHCSTDEKEKSFNDMIELALELTLKI